MPDIRILGPDEAAVLDHVAEDVFDLPINQAATAAFLADPRHHIAVAIEAGVVVGFVSGVDFLHPDKPRTFWINEIGVSPSQQRRGVAQALLARILGHAREIGCVEAWVLTDASNTAARGLYDAANGQELVDVVMVSFELEDGEDS